MEDILTFFNTWDNYQLSVFYLEILYNYNYKNNNKNNNNKNLFINSFSKLLLQNLHPNPLKRNSIQVNKEKWNQLLLDSTF